MAYGWQIKELRKLEKEKKSSKLYQDQLEALVYKEMIADYEKEEPKTLVVNNHQFRKALAHFQPSLYQEEIEAVFYFGKQMSSLEVELPNPNLVRYEDLETFNLAKTYMRRNEPNDYNYFKRIISRKDRIHFQYLTSRETFLGKSYFLSKDEFYILIHSQNGIQDAVTLLHESSHVENYLKYGVNLSRFYAELSPMTREHYSFELFSQYDSEVEVHKQKLLSLNHYLTRALRLYQALVVLLQLKKNSSVLKEVMDEYEKFCMVVDVSYLYTLLSGELEKEMGYVLSFIASLDIYNHCSARESNLFITSYQIGTRKVNSKIIDRVVPQLKEELCPYQKVKNI